MRTHSKENERLGKVVFLICIVLSIFAMSFCRGQLNPYAELPRVKYGYFWLANSLLTYDQNGDSVFFGSSYKPGPYDFDRIVVETKGRNGVVRDMVMTIYFENGTQIFLGAIPGRYTHGCSWFELTDSEKIKIRTLPIKKVELFNRETSDVLVFEDWQYQYYTVATNQ